MRGQADAPVREDNHVAVQLPARRLVAVGDNLDNH
eukprot:CAMPEP_0179846164 /NCGR_PEP_ID=MMETSP0982-20121206/5406_1 /TAXON_ID=483367 /ORGANISM="non described non described, Strain CCMP 2436" /LENGTH=34 /DNA_ID= /DNA_START= /DNA_END= /DNA_ORIENTATION=